MKKKRLLFAVAIAAAFGLSVVWSEESARFPEPARTSARPPSARVQTAKSERNQQLTVIGYLEKRDRVITIKSGSKGTVYSVASKDGKVLHDNLSAEQLKAQSPELHDLIKTGVAGDARARKPKIDASLRAY
jgi:hypothetical protein